MGDSGVRGNGTASIRKEVWEVLGIAVSHANVEKAKCIELYKEKEDETTQPQLPEWKLDEPHKYSLAHNVSFWAQKLHHFVIFWALNLC